LVGRLEKLETTNGILLAKVASLEAELAVYKNKKTAITRISPHPRTKTGLKEIKACER
jgi:hypothetical protein